MMVHDDGTVARGSTDVERPALRRCSSDDTIRRLEETNRYSPSRLDTVARNIPRRSTARRRRESREVSPPNPRARQSAPFDDAHARDRPSDLRRTRSPSEWKTMRVKRRHALEESRRRPLRSVVFDAASGPGSTGPRRVSSTTSTGRRRSRRARTRASTSSAIVSTDSDADEGDERIRTDADVEGDSSPTLARESSTARASGGNHAGGVRSRGCSETTGRDAPKSSRALSRNRARAALASAHLVASDQHALPGPHPATQTPLVPPLDRLARARVVIFLRLGGTTGLPRGDVEGAERGTTATTARGRDVSGRLDPVVSRPAETGPRLARRHIRRRQHGHVLFAIVTPTIILLNALASLRERRSVGDAALDPSRGPKDSVPTFDSRNRFDPARPGGAVAPRVVGPARMRINTAASRPVVVVARRCCVCRTLRSRVTDHRVEFPQ